MLKITGAQASSGEIFALVGFASCGGQAVSPLTK